MKKTYWEKLQDPRWQKKRLEAMQLKEFACEICGNKELNLHVHHKEYFKYLEPWQYHNSQLAILCEDCHTEFHHSVDALKMMCSYIPMEKRRMLAIFIGGLLNYTYESVLNTCQMEDQKTLKSLYKKGMTARKAFGVENA